MSGDMTLASLAHLGVDLSPLPGLLAQAGVAFATEQIIDLIANGVNHIHLYTMNKPWITRAILSNLSEILGHAAL